MLTENPLVSLLGMLSCVVLVLVLAYGFTRYVVGSGWLGDFKAGQRSERLRILAQTPVGKDQRLAVIQAGSRYLVVGMTQHSINLLAELTQEEAAEWKKETAESSSVMLSGFQQTLIDTWKKRKRGEEQ